MKNGYGNTYLNQWLSFWAQVAEPDFTRPVVRDWYKDSLMINAFNLGSSGWCTDFGEHHRVDMVTPNNSNPYTVHNEYPLDSAATQRTIYFPAGTWYNYSTGSIEATGPATKTVNALLDLLRVFIKEGTILLLYNREIETLVKNVPGIKDFGYADSTMELQFYGCGTDEFTLWDSTVVQMHRYTGDSAINITGGHQRQYSSEFVNDPSLTCTCGMVQTNPQQTLSVFPNPTTGIFNLSFNTQQESVAQIQVLNSLGSLILEETIFIAQKSVEKQIYIGNFPSDLYLLKVTYGN